MKDALLAPIVALVTLTVIVWLRMYVIRIRSAVKFNIGPEDMRVENPKLPSDIRTSGDNLRNLLEMPILFYLCAVLLIEFDSVDQWFVSLAWTYVGLRCTHSLIHTTYNRVMHRFIAYVLSCLVLFAMWIRFAMTVW